MPHSDTAPALDDETTAALTLFNEYVQADRERTQREKRVKKAERAKDDAAAAVKKLEEKGGSAQDKAEAETTYREAAERWKALRDGKEPEPTPPKNEPAPAEDAAPAEDTDTATTEDSAAEDAAPADEPAAEEAAPAEDAAPADEPAPAEAAAGGIDEEE